ncbi:uncharacterized protein RCC_08490 [Ramularia collo-cygni]|uniref:Small ribosomal subunit protein mS38 n=1 Tax=Ramularia collo-cygni TaxID=112498 RepID=A0A2D3VKC1_9PEZI|nr:uncharacterized protein RCC_08490 [Ramularia collo-cygni]CZT22784.1 uncharacterized protein RCC_08490 [Ramularia collo-cygni]
MISSKLTHLAHRTSCVASISSPASSTAAATAHRSTQCAAVRARRPHQRRHSSSKASCPPENSATGGKPTPATKETAELSNPETTQKGNKRIPRTKRSRPATAAKSEDQFAGLPAVPGTQHINYADLTVSSFFSLHRPLSLATTIPPPSSAGVFDSIFETRPEQDPWEHGNSAEGRPEDVTYALTSLFKGLGIGGAGEDSMRVDMMSESMTNQDGVTHLDGPPQLKSLDEVVASFKPYAAPPAPEPFLSEPESKVADKKRSTRKKTEKRYLTTIFLTESTAENGESTWTASSSPVVAVPEPQRPRFQEGKRQRELHFWRALKQKMLEQTDATQSIRKAPSAAQKYKMLLISVKRQRKLKMKKHKYKKLMKRTRNLRRRQDRA